MLEAPRHWPLCGEFTGDVLNKQSVDLLAISESKLDNNIPDSQFQAIDCAIYGQDLTSSSDGLLVYIRADFPHRRMGKLEINCQSFESLCLEIVIGKTKKASCSVYNIYACDVYGLRNLIKTPTCH